MAPDVNTSLSTELGMTGGAVRIFTYTLPWTPLSADVLLTAEVVLIMKPARPRNFLFLSHSYDNPTQEKLWV